MMPNGYWAMKAVNLHKIYFEYITEIANRFEGPNELPLEIEFSFLFQPFFHMRAAIDRGVYDQ